MFLIRTAFWLTLVLVLLPIDREEAGIASGPGTFETLAAMQTVVADMRGFCDRNPRACATGSQSVEVLRQKAVYSAGIVQTWLSEPGAQTVVHATTTGDNQPNRIAPMQGTDDQVAALIQAADQRPAAYPPL